jgi:hypothetical protein
MLSVFFSGTIVVPKENEYQESDPLPQRRFLDDAAT